MSGSQVPVTPVRFVYFDAGGTLIAPWPSVGGVYARAGRAHDLTASAEALDTAFRSVWKRVTGSANGGAPWAGGASQTDCRDLWRAIVEDVFDRVGFAGNRTACFTEIYEAFSRADAWHVFEDVRPALEVLRERGLRMGVLSNWDYRLPGLLATLELDRFFEPIVVSAREGLQKPDPRFYLRACERAAVAPHETLHVGDQAALDWEPARAAGLEALLLRRGTGESDQSTIRSLAEVPPRLQAPSQATRNSRMMSS